MLRGNIPKPSVPSVPFPKFPDSKDLLPKGLDRPGEILRHLAEITEKEKNAVINNIDQQIDKYTNDLARFTTLLEAKVYKVTQPVLDAKDKINDAIKKLKKSKDIVFDQYKVLKDEYIKTFTTIRTDISTYIFEELHLDKINEFYEEGRRFQADAQIATTALNKLGILSDSLKKKLDRITGNTPASDKQRKDLQNDIDSTLEKMNIKRSEITKLPDFFLEW